MHIWHRGCDSLICSTVRPRLQHLPNCLLISRKVISHLQSRHLFFDIQETAFKLGPPGPAGRAVALSSALMRVRASQHTITLLFLSNLERGWTCWTKLDLLLKTKDLRQLNIPDPRSDHAGPGFHSSMNFIFIPRYILVLFSFSRFLTSRMV